MIVKPCFKIAYKLLPKSLKKFTLIIFISVYLIFITEVCNFKLVFLLLAYFIGELIIRYFIKKKQYDNYSYEFYQDKVICKNNFIDRSEKEVKYKYIKEVTMNQTFFQKIFNIGNINLLTSAESGYDSGAKIVDVENVEKIYRSIKNIIGS